MSRRIIRIVAVVVVAAAFSACSNPLAPAGKVPTQVRDNVINPNGNVINPNGNVVNPNGNVVNPNG